VVGELEHPGGTVFCGDFVVGLLQRALTAGACRGAQQPPGRVSFPQRLDRFVLHRLTSRLILRASA